MVHLNSLADTATLPRSASSEHDRDAPMQHRQRGELPASTRSLRAIALCLCACFGCWSPLLGQTPDDQIPPSFSSVSGVVPLKRSKKPSNLWGSHSPRLSVLYQTRNGVGYDQGFWSMQSFVPFAHQCDRRVTFFDLHALFNEDGALGGNFGVGNRVFMPGLNATVGGFVYYDYRDTGFNKFQQISPGLDVFGNGWELHANGYLPTIAQTRQSLPDQFRGFSLFLDRFESAMSGADIELGVQLPLLEKFQPKLFAGAYTFDASGRRDATGWKTRLEASPADALGVAVSLQDDQVFGTTANFGVEFRLAGRSLLSRRPFRDVARGLKARPSQSCARDYLAGSTRRLNQIVIDRESTGTVARDPNTGDPINFLHVAAGGNSNGAFEDPYALLTDALADPRYTAGDIDVIYVRSGLTQSVTHTGEFAMVAGTQLLSNGPLQSVATQLGMRRLPFSGIDINLQQLPQIIGTVNLADSTVLSGFDITATDTQNPDLHGAVQGIDVKGVTIRNNVILGDQTGILMLNIFNADSAADRIVIDGNRTDGNPYAGIQFVLGDRMFADITNNRADGNAVGGIEIIGVNHFVGDISGNQSNQNTESFASGLNINGVGIFEGNISNNTMEGNDHGLFIASENMKGDITGNRLDANASSGMSLLVTTFEGNITNNIIDGRGDIGAPGDPSNSRIFNPVTQPPPESPPMNSFGDGILVLGGTFKGNIADNQLRNHGSDGLILLDANFEGNITNNESVGNGGDGIVVYNSTIEGDITENTGSKNRLGGITLFDTDLTGNISRNIVNENDNQGILVNGDTFFEGNLSDNTALKNGADGVMVSLLDFTGSISDNILSENGFSGITLFFDTLNGDIIGNQVAENGARAEEFNALGRGISVRSFFLESGTFNGDIANNTVLNNFSVGIEVDGHTFTGNIFNNISNGSREHGIFIRDPVPSFTGNISGNTTNNNGLGGIGISTPIFIGDVFNNTANMNAGSGGIAVGVFGTPAQFTGNIFGNTANMNTESGGILVSNTIFTGNITDNVTLQNTDYGIILGLFAGNTLIGDIARNTSNLNSLSGIGIFSSDLTGNVTGNTTNQNNFGIDAFSSSINGAISGNASQSNTLTGIDLYLDGTSNVIAENNVLAGNNNGGTEFRSVNQGTGAFNLFLSGNSSTNVVPAGQFNFDLINSGGGFFNVTPVNVNDVNTGTVGSSDGSVTIP